MIYNWTKWAAILFSLFLLASCGKDSGSELGTISGVVYDISFSPPGSDGDPLAGATVTLRNTSNAALSSTTTTNDGTYTLANVPPSTDVYINVSKTNYASVNGNIFQLRDLLPDQTPRIMFAQAARYEADKFYGSAGGSDWNDSFYTGKSWFSMDIYEPLILLVGIRASGVVVSSTLSVVIRYNDGTDDYMNALSTHTAGTYPQVGGYDFATEIATFTCTKGDWVSTVKLPLVQGELTYARFSPWEGWEW
jgi:hypothetical protein